ncbi:hypothetical protein JD844_031523 [Phrynosoma platyrhinos]|uniref:Uncharacterized protein n=1 Tax=Phrynosoma platyrhinos TaxID=52577 RepID=A0ABQ7T1D1_PHRPL|nr:hypothetical protein JD844_031523 [Phrynosoma platyrhinos]
MLSVASQLAFHVAPRPSNPRKAKKFAPAFGKAGYSSPTNDRRWACVKEVYNICRDASVRNQEGQCLTKEEWTQYCADKVCASPKDYQRYDKVLGLCLCQADNLDSVCNPQCRRRQRNILQFICDQEPARLSLNHRNGSQADILLEEIKPSLQVLNFHSEKDCTSEEKKGSQPVYVVKTNGTSGKENPRFYWSRLQQPSNSTLKITFTGIFNPTACLRIHEIIMFIVSKDHYPIYDVNNLYNTNLEFDWGGFRSLAEEATLTSDTSDVLLFFYQFHDPGTYVLRLSSNQHKRMVCSILWHVLQSGYEIWDSEEQIDLDSFNTNVFFEILVTQSLAVTAKLSQFKEELKLLYHKLLEETASLRDLWIAKVGVPDGMELSSDESVRNYTKAKHQAEEEIQRKRHLATEYEECVSRQLCLLTEELKSHEEHWVAFHSALREATRLTELLADTLSSGEESKQDHHQLLNLIDAASNQMSSLITKESHRLMLWGILGEGTGGHLVNKEKTRLLTKEELVGPDGSVKAHDALHRDATTGLIMPRDDAVMLLANQSMKHVPPDHFLHPGTGKVLPVAGNIGFNPINSKLIPTVDLSSDELHRSARPIFPYVPYPMCPNTGLPVPRNLPILQPEKVFKLGGFMHDPASGIEVPILAVTIHPQTGQKMTLGGTYLNPLTGMLTPLEFGGPMRAPEGGKIVPILGVTLDSNTGNVIPLGGLQGSSENLLLIGDSFMEPQSGKVARVQGLSLQEGKMAPHAGGYKAVLEANLLIAQIRMAKALKEYKDDVWEDRCPAGDGQTALKMAEEDMMKALSQKLDYLMYWLQNLEKQQECASHLKSTGGKLGLVPLAIGFRTIDPITGEMGPVIGAQINPWTMAVIPVVQSLGSLPRESPDPDLIRYRDKLKPLDEICRFLEESSVQEAQRRANRHLKTFWDSQQSLQMRARVRLLLRKMLERLVQFIWKVQLEESRIQMQLKEAERQRSSSLQTLETVQEKSRKIALHLVAAFEEHITKQRANIERAYCRLEYLRNLLDTVALQTKGLGPGQDQEGSIEWDNLLKELAEFHWRSEEELSQQHWEETKDAGLIPEEVALEDGTLFSLEEILQNLALLCADLQKAGSSLSAEDAKENSETHILEAELSPAGSAAQKMQATAVKIVRQEALKQIRIHKVLERYNSIQRRTFPEEILQVLGHLCTGGTMAQDMVWSIEKQQVERAMTFLQKEKEEELSISISEMDEAQLKRLQALIGMEMQLEAKEAEAVREATKQNQSLSADGLVYFLLSGRHLRQVARLLEASLGLQEAGSTLDENTKGIVHLLKEKTEYAGSVAELQQASQMLRLRERHFQETVRKLKAYSSDQRLENADQIASELQKFRQEKTKELEDHLRTFLSIPKTQESPSYNPSSLQKLLREHEETMAFLDKAYQQERRKRRERMEKERRKKYSHQQDRCPPASNTGSMQGQHQPNPAEKDKVFSLLAEYVKILKQTELLVMLRIFLLNPRFKTLPSGGNEVDANPSSQILALLNEVNCQFQKCASALGLLDNQYPEYDTASFFQDIMDIQMTPKSGELVPLLTSSLSAREFVIYQYGIVILQFLRPLLGGPEIDLCLASSIPSSNAPGNAFRNTFYYQVCPPLG